MTPEPMGCTGRAAAAFALAELAERLWRDWARDHGALRAAQATDESPQG
jgi:hypothetical protein